MTVAILMQPALRLATTSYSVPLVNDPERCTSILHDHMRNGTPMAHGMSLATAFSKLLIQGDASGTA